MTWPEDMQLSKEQSGMDAAAIDIATAIRALKTD